MGGGKDLGRRALLGVLLHEAVDLEPVAPPAVATAGLGHAHTKALLEPAGLAGGAVPLVDDAAVVVLALRDHSLVVTEPPEEALAALAGEGTKVEAGGFLVTHSAQLVLQAVDVVHSLRHAHLVGEHSQIRNHVQTLCPPSVEGATEGDWAGRGVPSSPRRALTALTGARLERSAPGTSPRSEARRRRYQN